MVGLAALTRPLRLVLRIGLTSAAGGLRGYQVTAMLLGGTLLGAISSILPLAILYGRPDDWLGFRPIISPIFGGDLGLPWMTGVAGPSVAQEQAASSLGTLLLLSLSGTLLVVIVTILSLGTARSAERRIERLIQRAVGGSRRTLLAAALAELVTLAAIPALVGTLIGLGLAGMAEASWPGRLGNGTHTVAIVAAALLVAAFAGVLLVPAMISPRRIREVETHQALPSFPVVFQNAVCFIVLSTGAILSGRAREVLDPEGGKAGNGTIVSLSLRSDVARERSAELRSLLQALNAAGLESVSLTSPGTIGGLGHVAMVLTDCGMCTENGLHLPFRLKPAAHKIVSADTFRLLGIPVLAGRGITLEDDWDAPRVAVVNRSLGGREFQDGKPIGRRIHTGDDGGKGSIVVGVVDDPPPIGLGGTFQPRHAVYVSVLQHPPRTVELLVRNPPDNATLAKIVDSAMVYGSGRYTLYSEQSFRESAMAPVRWFGTLFELEGWASLGLASLGIMVFMNLWVKALSGEMAIRRSVGANRRQILQWVLLRGLGIALKGVLAGLWFGIAVWTTLPSVVAGITVWRWSHFLPYAVLLLVVVLSAVLVPAWRMSRRFPADLLQSAGG